MRRCSNEAPAYCAGTTSNPIGKTAHHDRGPLRRGGGLATSHAICLCGSDKATVRGRRYGTVDSRFLDAGVFPPCWPEGDPSRTSWLFSPFPVCLDRRV